jgi:pimeloyl-ACP methyl ester carboxylesterase
MFVQHYGQGERIFFGLHGWSGNHATFAPLARFLPADAMIVSPDLPGYGQSPPPRAWTLEMLAKELAGEIEKLNAPVTLIGNCSGALLGLSAMELLPPLAQRINRLVMIDPFAYLPVYFKLFVTPPFGKYAYLSTFANPVGRWITNLSLKSHRTEETDLTGSFRRVDHHVSYRYLELLAGIDGIQRWAGLHKPVDIVFGERSFGAIKTSVGMWKGIWPQSRAFELPGAGHLPILEATEALSRIVFQEPITKPNKL